MRKIWVIIQREYWTRVRTRAFILGTLLMPLGMALLFTIPILAALTVEEESVKVLIHDESGDMVRNLKSDTHFIFEPTTESWDQVKPKIAKGEVYVHVPAHAADSGNLSLRIMVSERLSIQIKEGIQQRMREAVSHYRLQLAGISQSQVKAADASIHLAEENAKGEKSSAEAGMIAGYVMSMLIYILMIMYGMFVMRGVIEEKTSRILEVVISSVKPFQLMMGKLIGICMVGLTQFLLWMILSGILTTVIGAIAGSIMGQQPPVQAGGMPDMAAPGQGMDPAIVSSSMEMIGQVLSIRNMMLFLFYFLGGFFLYGSLFAAAGSAVDQEQDAQQLTWPIMIPLILPIMLMTNVLQNPNGKLAVFLSIFPFSSPTIMMVRVTATDVPWYELLISMALLVLAIFGCVWVASRIYRVGVLMYGKKATLREIGRWMFRT